VSPDGPASSVTRLAAPTRTGVPTWTDRHPWILVYTVRTERILLSPTFWRWFHWTCAAAIPLAVAFNVVTTRVHRFTDYALLVGESVAIVSFGLSWLMKGLELEVLLGQRAARRRLVREAAVETG
jgi:hypothetical protein